MTSNQSHPTERELVYCHACTEEWYRDEHGLVCPRSTCGSDAVEIVSFPPPLFLITFGGTTIVLMVDLLVD